MTTRCVIIEALAREAIAAERREDAIAPRGDPATVAA